MTMWYTEEMKRINAAQFKEKCLSILDNVDPEGILITKHGKPVARLLPVATSPDTLLGCLKGKIEVRGDILTSGAKWNAES